MNCSASLNFLLRKIKCRHSQFCIRNDQDPIKTTRYVRKKENLTHILENITCNQEKNQRS